MDTRFIARKDVIQDRIQSMVRSTSGASAVASLPASSGA